MQYLQAQRNLEKKKVQQPQLLTEPWKQFRLTKGIQSGFLMTSYNKQIQSKMIDELRHRRLVDNNSYARKKQIWEEMSNRNEVLNYMNEVIHAEQQAGLAKQSNPFFQQLYNNETPLSAKRVSRISFKNDTYTLQYTFDQSDKSSIAQSKFDQMIYKDASDDFISSIDEEEDNVRINLKLNNWIELYFTEAQPKQSIPQYQLDTIFNSIISLAFLYKFIKNIEI